MYIETFTTSEPNATCKLMGINDAGCHAVVSKQNSNRLKNANVIANPLFLVLCYAFSNPRDVSYFLGHLLFMYDRAYS